VTGTAASAARIREIAAERPPAGLDMVHLAAWWAVQFGAMAWHAEALADVVDPGGKS
jgi:hypothetical protein